MYGTDKPENEHCTDMSLNRIKKSMTAWPQQIHGNCALNKPDERLSANKCSKSVKVSVCKSTILKNLAGGQAVPDQVCNLTVSFLRQPFRRGLLALALHLAHGLFAFI